MGRPKGSPNRQPISFKRIQDALENAGHDPLQTQIRFAMGDDGALKLPAGTITPSMRKAANEFLLERMYPTLKAVDVQHNEQQALVVRVVNFSDVGDPVLLAINDTTGLSSKEADTLSNSPKSLEPSPVVEAPPPDPLRVLRKAGERPIADNLGQGSSVFGTVVPARKG